MVLCRHFYYVFTMKMYVAYAAPMLRRDVWLASKVSLLRVTADGQELFLCIYYFFVPVKFQFFKV